MPNRQNKPKCKPLTYSYANQAYTHQQPVDGCGEEVFTLAVLDHSVSLQHMVTERKQHSIYHTLKYNSNKTTCG